MKYIIYVSHPDTQEIKVWSFNIKKKLTLIQSIHIVGNAQPMIINYKKKLLYVGIRPNFAIITFKIKEDGSLLKLGKTLLNCSPSYLCCDKNFCYLFVASYNNSLFTISNIKENGIPNVPYKIVEQINGCHSVNINLNNNILFVPALLEDCIYIYYLNKKGMIDPYHQIKIKSKKNSGPRHMSFHPNKKYIYSINEINSTVDVWNIEQDTINHIHTANILPKHHIKKWASDIHISPDGKYLYTCDRSASLITVFKIKKNGFLEFIEYQSTEEQPREFEIDKNGQFLFIVGQKSSFISVYKINKIDGTLKHISRQLSGKNPSWVTTFIIK